MCLRIIACSCVYAAISYLVRVVQLMGVGALAGTPSVVAVHGDVIFLAMLTQPGGGQSLHSG